MKIDNIYLCFDYENGFKELEFDINEIKNLYKENQQLKKQLEYYKTQEIERINKNLLDAKNNYLENCVKSNMMFNANKEEKIIFGRGTSRSFTLYVSELIKENKQLKDNWNKLKESLKFDIELYDTTLLHRKMTSDKILKEMEELEKGDSNE